MLRITVSGLADSSTSPDVTAAPKSREVLDGLMAVSRDPSPSQPGTKYFCTAKNPLCGSLVQKTSSVLATPAQQAAMLSHKLLNRCLFLAFASDHPRVMHARVMHAHPLEDDAHLLAAYHKQAAWLWHNGRLGTCTFWLCT